ncbi:MAG: SpoIID/LytB domain-containing protein [Oscillospiraceae bacterium]|jgi:stage II sporulation protein D|nr:SpoIID/LytB domain-containing protein [Oscillospiraceae bacterium]
MKNAVIILLMFAALLFLVPYLWGAAFPAFGNSSVSQYRAPESFRVFLTENEEIIEISAVDYLIGCLYAQIPPGYHTEALKAQAVAAHTYALRLALNNQNFPQEGIAGADFSNSSVTCQPFFTETEARDYYGIEYEVYYNQIREAAEYGASRAIVHAFHNNEPIYAVYHGVSAGATNTASYIWGVDFPYLKSVPSDWDRDFAAFVSTNEISTSQMRSRLLDFDPEIIMPLDYARWFSEYNSDSSGYVIEVSTRNTNLSGGDLWRILNLRSAAFEINFIGGVFVATTLGHGHGVGLSQFGADFMARRGHTCDEILDYYFTDVTILSISRG